MNKYFIYKKNEDYICVKDGFYFSAFIFNILWLVYSKLWKPILLFLPLILIVNLLTEVAPEAIYGQIFISLVIGFSAPYLLHDKLVHSGYTPEGIIYEKNDDLALLTFLRNTRKRKNFQGSKEVGNV